MVLVAKKTNTSSPGYRQIAADIIAKIESGKMPAGAPLEPTRVLSQQLQVSRDTVVRAYKILRDNNFVESDGIHGTFVSKRIAVASKADTRKHEITLSQFGKTLIEDDIFLPPDLDFSKLNYSAVPKEALPVRRWREIMLEQCQLLKSNNLVFEVDVAGRLELRSSLARHLHNSRGINATANEIIIFNISLTAVGLIFKLLLEAGDTVAVEDPGYGAVKQLIKLQKLKLATIEVDDQGINIDFLNSCNPVPKLVYVTPCHQDPTGVTMSLARRQALIKWAERNDSYIIEDDFDSSFSYSGAQIPALKALDTSGRVIYVSTFWQILYPLTTASFIVAPPSITTALLRGKGLSEGVAEAMMQTTLAEMINSGFLQGHLRRWNKIFAARRIALTLQLKKAFGAAIDIQNQCGGLTMTVRFHQLEPEKVIEAAAQAALPLVDIFSLYEHNQKHCYLLPFAAVEESQAGTKVTNFYNALCGK